MSEMDLSPQSLKLVETGAAILLYLILRYVIGRFTMRSLKKFSFTIQRRKTIGQILQLLLTIILFLTLLGIWGLSGAQILLYLTSILAVIGVALFAQWSILSNITSGVVLYFNHPLKLGDYVKIVDKDVPLDGYVENISLYFVHMKTKTGEQYTIPNNVVLQKIITVIDSPNPVEIEIETE